MDFDLNAYRPCILSILHTQRDALLWNGSLEAVEITMLGIGESNLMLLLVLDGQLPLTMRIAYREDIGDKYLPQEFRLLQQLPDGLGPQPFLLDMSRRALPYPFAILSFIPGTTPANWTEKILRVHATNIARMHQRESATWTTREGKPSSAPFDFYQMFQENITRWRKLSPWIFEDELIIRLLPQLNAYFHERNHLFTSLSRFSLIHGDLCAPNILVHEGDIRYIDWEYARYGDGALDIAQLAWDIDNPPWQIKLADQQLAMFFQTYLAQRPDPTLIERYKAWCVTIKFIDHITHRRTASRSNSIKAFSNEYYQTVSQRLLDSLAQQFL